MWLVRKKQGQTDSLFSQMQQDDATPPTIVLLNPADGTRDDNSGTLRIITANTHHNSQFCPGHVCPVCAWTAWAYPSAQTRRKWHLLCRELLLVGVLELLLRVWQRSDQGALQRAAGAASLLLVELPMERLPEDVPRLKADWLNTGDTSAFKAGLQAFSPRAWTVLIEKFKPVALQPLW